MESATYVLKNKIAIMTNNRQFSKLQSVVLLQCLCKTLDQLKENLYKIDPELALPFESVFIVIALGCHV